MGRLANRGRQNYTTQLCLHMLCYTLEGGNLEYWGEACRHARRALRLGLSVDGRNVLEIYSRGGQRKIAEEAPTSDITVALNTKLFRIT